MAWPNDSGVRLARLRILSGVAIYLLVQPLLLTLAMAGSARVSPLHSHVSLGAVPEHSHWYDPGAGASTIPPGCGAPDRDGPARASSDRSAALTCTPSGEVSVGAVTAIMLAAQPAVIRFAGLEHLICASRDAEPGSWHARPVTPPPEHAL